MSVFTEYIYRRVMRLNKNFFLLVVGATGSGKSYSALRLAEVLDPSFNISRVAFKAREFMEIINSVVNSNKDFRGKVILWDEIGTEHSAREFMSITNRMINYFFQTCRHLNLIVIMTVPVMSFIDSNSRKLIHSIAETRGTNRRKKTVTLKVKMLQTNPMTGKEYFKLLRYRKGEKQCKLSSLRVGMPSKVLVDKYEQKKREFSAFLSDKIMNQLDKIEGKKPLSPLQLEIYSLIEKGITRQDDIAERLGKSQQFISKSMASMRKKGINIAELSQKALFSKKTNTIGV